MPRRRQLSESMADAEVRKRRERAGLETPLVYAVNDAGSPLRENAGV